ncbi:uncharacterized protein [Montipora capricornis]|uniref:uncharacterized protein n=1 Tax=Montipora capricornis TaxID=246305 RepID=UPI0035F117F8
MPTLNDQVVSGSSGQDKQDLQQALLDLLKGDPDILNRVVKQSVGSKDDRKQRSSSASRDSCQLQTSDSDENEELDFAWNTATKNMTPRELNRWRQSLFSVYVGHLPWNFTKQELIQVFGRVGNIQDVHVNPGKQSGHTYGFVRFCTLDECNEAISVLHGHVIGNKNIIVEYSSDTKDRLGGKSKDMPVDRKDSLLKKHFPRVQLYHHMSDAEAQEKMILWKLRSSVARQISSARGSAKSADTVEQDNDKETIMDKIQEIAEKVAGLAPGTCADTSGSEASEYSSWILKESQRHHHHHMTPGENESAVSKGKPSSSRSPDPKASDSLTSRDSEEVAVEVFSDKHLEKREAKDQYGSIEIPSVSPSRVTNVECGSRRLGSLKNTAARGPVHDSANSSIMESNMTRSLHTPSPEKTELKRIQRENDSLENCINWSGSGETAEGALCKEERDALKAQIHLKEVQVQQEKEINLARKAEQEILYEREKLEAAFDPQLQKELEREKKVSEINNKVRLAKLKNELLKLYAQLNGIIESEEHSASFVI